MTPTALLLVAASVATVRARGAAHARGLRALLALDLFRHACRLIDRAAPTPAEVWLLRIDGAIMAGGWCAVVAWLLLQRDEDALADVGRREDGRVEQGPRGLLGLARFLLQMPGEVPGVRASGAAFALVVYGAASVVVARAWPAAWLPLLLGPRFAVGALAWYSSLACWGCTDRRRRGEGPRERLVGLGIADVPRPLLVGRIIAACEVASAVFLWARWGDVNLLSSACWASCAWASARCDA